MAVSHVAFNDQLPHGRKLRASMNKMDEGLNEFLEVLAVLETMKDDGAVGEYLQTKFGFPDPKTAGEGVAKLSTLRDKFTPVLADMIALLRQFG